MYWISAYILVMVLAMYSSTVNFMLYSRLCFQLAIPDSDMTWTRHEHWQGGSAQSCRCCSSKYFEWPGSCEQCDDLGWIQCSCTALRSHVRMYSGTWVISPVQASMNETVQCFMSSCWSMRRPRTMVTTLFNLHYNIIAAQKIMLALCASSCMPCHSQFISVAGNITSYLGSTLV